MALVEVTGLVLEVEEILRTFRRQPISRASLDPTTAPRCHRHRFSACTSSAHRLQGPDITFPSSNRISSSLEHQINSHWPTMRLPYVPNPPQFENEADQAIVERVQKRRGERGLMELDLALLNAPPVADGWSVCPSQPTVLLPPSSNSHPSSGTALILSAN